MVHMVQKRDITLDVILILLSGDMHLREISRALKISHTTLSRKLDELLRLGILDYRLVGKNKLFSLKNNLKARNVILNAERYKLNLFLEKYPKLNILFDDIIKTAGKHMILLFGSYAKFDSNINSDIDIYINSSVHSLKEKVESLNSRLSVKLGEFNQNSLLIKEIIKNHIILRGAEEFYEEIFH